MIIKGKVTRVVVLEKEVEIEVPDDLSEAKMNALVAEKAYESGIMSTIDKHGWACTKVKSIVVEATKV